MPIYEYYCPDNHRIYQFYAKTLAQGQRIPRCPDNPQFRMEKILSPFAVVGRRADDPAEGANGEIPGGGEDDPRMAAAMSAMEREFANVDENDPKAMGRMMRRMAELTGEKIDGEMEEVVRKLEEGADPDALEEQFGDGPGGEGGDGGEFPPGGADVNAPPEAKETKVARRLAALRRREPTRDPQLYDYD